MTDTSKGLHSRESFQNLANHSFSYLFPYVSGIFVKSFADLCLPLGESILESFRYLGPPFFPSFILFRKPSTKAHTMHQGRQGLVVEGFRETQHNIIFAGVQLPQCEA